MSERRVAVGVTGLGAGRRPAPQKNAISEVPDLTKKVLPSAAHHQEYLKCSTKEWGFRASHKPDPKFNKESEPAAPAAPPKPTRINAGSLGGVLSGTEPLPPPARHVHAGAYATPSPRRSLPSRYVSGGTTTLDAELR